MNHLSRYKLLAGLFVLGALVLSYQQGYKAGAKHLEAVIVNTPGQWVVTINPSAPRNGTHGLDDETKAILRPEVCGDRSINP